MPVQTSQRSWSKHVDDPAEIYSKDQSKPHSPEGILNPDNGSREDVDPLFLPVSLQRSNSGHSLDAASSVIQRDDSDLSDELQWGLYEARPSGDMKGPCDESTTDKGPIVVEPGRLPLPPLPETLSLCPLA
ncbi:hypothetical protein Nepgr_002688 [Nepenthes gracilis]|uniref:Uncharacterized protein n=1 Tax=Nepenthes gracilis TaxID=150966 RepID=A0AAD3P9X9_NEPGR|nr:hypothetical protein Nepgr_002688 [Nepenthes gracilis]